jgi:hypothetical protein
MLINVSTRQARLLARYPRALQFWLGSLATETVVVKNHEGSVRVIRPGLENSLEVLGRLSAPAQG